MIVDDWEALDIYEAELGPHFRITAFPMAKEGLAWAAAHPPDHILLDLTFPDVTPDEALAVLRSHESSRPIPVIVIGETGEAFPDADGMVHRPFTFPDLAEKIRKTLRKN